MRPLGAGRRAAAAMPAALLLLIAMPGAARAQDEGLGLPPGTAAPDAQVEDLEGNSVSLLDVIGSGPALVEFWASWCEQCELLQPQIDQIQERFAEQVKVVAVAVAVNQSVRRVRRHVERHAPGYAFVYDANGEARESVSGPHDLDCGSDRRRGTRRLHRRGAATAPGRGGGSDARRRIGSPRRAWPDSGSEPAVSYPSSGSGVTSSITAASSS